MLQFEVMEKTHAMIVAMSRLFRALFLIAPMLCSLSLWAEAVSWTGWISDSKCGSRMSGYGAKACITAGEKPVFVRGDKQIIAITNPDLTKGYDGERVRVKGSFVDGN